MRFCVKSGVSAQVDLLSLIGLLIGFAGILLGQFLEGGSLTALLNGPAMLIVFGGSLGAVMVQSSPPAFWRAMRMFGWIFVPPRVVERDQVQRIVRWSHVARKEGLLGLENDVDHEQDPFAQKALQLLVDGNEPETIRNIMEVEIDTLEHKDLQGARVWDSLGGYSPTIGIIGAVIGLIQVMHNLADPSRLGLGIATAFIATIYGVGLANLVFLPVGAKLRGNVNRLTIAREMLVDGVVSIAEGENPRNIETKLQGYLKD